MADAHVPQENVKAIFKQLLDVHKHNIRLIVLEELISECYGPQPLLNGRRITDIISFKEWLEAKLQEAKQQDVMREMSFQEKMTIGRTLLDKHGLSNWSVSIENINNPNMFTHDYGCEELDGGCIHTKQTIYIDSMCADNKFRQTVLHEIAHALTPEDHNHGKKWRAIFTKLQND